jgi:hypothetical protein
VRAIGAAAAGEVPGAVVAETGDRPWVPPVLARAVSLEGVGTETTAGRSGKTTGSLGPDFAMMK